MKFQGHTSREWLNSANMWKRKAASYGPDMESSRQSCLQCAEFCTKNAERARWHVASHKGKIYLYEDGLQVARLKYESFGRNSLLQVAKWFTTRSQVCFFDLCDSLTVSETLEALTAGGIK